MPWFNGRGFTLLELLVVITIIAMLSTVAFVFYTGAQKNARDAKRRIDINAIASALETNKNPASTNYPKLKEGYFASNQIPQDKQAAKYCVAYFTTAGSTPAGKPTIWDKDASPCPTQNNNPEAPFFIIDSINPPDEISVWTICALLENDYNSETDFQVYCRFNSQ